MVRTALGRRIAILTGKNGGIFPPFELLRCGADGAMTGFAYPEMLEAVRPSPRRPQGADACGPLRPLPAAGALRAAAGTGPCRTQIRTMRRGAIAGDTTRAPAPHLSDASRREIDWLCDRLEARLRRNDPATPILMDGEFRTAYYISQPGTM
ncbi:MAG: hypothetical protein R3D03_14480 [Geminicoccaceae bacterium]